MQIKSYLMIFLLLIQCNLCISRTSLPEWSWSNFELHSWIGLDDININKNSIITNIENCLNNLEGEESCGDAYVLLILLTRLDTDKSIVLSNRVLSLIESDNLNYDILNLRENAIRSLAYTGDSSHLITELGSSIPNQDDQYVLGQISDFRWSDQMLASMKIEEPYSYCKALNYIYPYLTKNNSSHSQFIELLILNINNSNKKISECSSIYLINVANQLHIQFDVKSMINSLLIPDNIESNKIAMLLIERWPTSMILDSSLISKIIKMSIITIDADERYYLSNVLVNTGIISDRFSLEDLQDDEASDEVYNTGESHSEDLTEYLISHPFNSVWTNYFNSLNFTEIKILLSELIEEYETPVNFNEKISYMRNSQIINNSLFLKFKLAQVAVNKNTSEANSLLNELFTSSDNLQKNALIARFPIQFSSKEVMTINETNPWLKLANLTNLLVICGVEVPPIENELSDPEMLTKYLEEGNELLNGCTRLESR